MVALVPLAVPFVEFMAALEAPALHAGVLGKLWGEPMKEGRWFVEPAGKMFLLPWQEVHLALYRAEAGLPAYGKAIAQELVLMGAEMLLMEAA